MGVYSLRDRDFSEYAEYRVAFELADRGWRVYQPLLDRYIDIVAIKVACNNDHKHDWDATVGLCKTCNSLNSEIIMRTIQVKASRVELEGQKGSYGVDHRPKDLLHDHRHFFIWLFFDTNSKEHFIILSPRQFVNLSGTGVDTLTWRANRGRYHPASDLRALKQFENAWDLLLSKGDDDPTTIITGQEVDKSWVGDNHEIIERWKAANDNVVKAIPRDMYERINRKTSILKWKLGEK